MDEFIPSMDGDDMMMIVIVSFFFGSRFGVIFFWVGTCFFCLELKF